MRNMEKQGVKEKLQYFEIILNNNSSNCLFFDVLSTIYKQFKNPK